MTELEKALDYLEKAKDNISREPDKCLIYIERAIQIIKEFNDMEVFF